MWTRIFKSEEGQTAIEYLLLIVVAVSIGLTFMKKMDEYLIQNPDGMIAKPLNSYKQSLGTPQDRYRSFPLRR